MQKRICGNKRETSKERKKKSMSKWVKQYKQCNKSTRVHGANANRKEREKNRFISNKEVTKLSTMKSTPFTRTVPPPIVPTSMEGIVIVSINNLVLRS